MLAFNCTKAAADFFTIVRKGQQYTLIQQSPNNSIAEDIQQTDTLSGKNNFHWHWVLHCVSIKRKKYLLAMDYLSRYCLAFPAPKKGDDSAFLTSGAKISGACPRAG
ncbi:hypothetical protein D5018_20110 [Parashewanella curva]|uniref:DUF6933 domain-containing protein n=1 Tax=Parashewanella curva TaxID=2338552 RepID=A0A3L8PR84_9GAMM|nr:hypothetical protein [Parashewanella curva]RLV57890.1 hypothetical protein D5018_20110 [Parashewanella curva]